VDLFGDAESWSALAQEGQTGRAFVGLGEHKVFALQEAALEEEVALALLLGLAD
jgi:hypothetical protein